MMNEGIGPVMAVKGVDSIGPDGCLVDADLASKQMKAFESHKSGLTITSGVVFALVL